MLLHRLQEAETALREALQEKELLERKLARLQASREGEVAALKVQPSAAMHFAPWPAHRDAWSEQSVPLQDLFQA